jgi:hypothetical protein
MTSKSGSAPDLLVMGSMTVLVNGLPWVGVTDVTAHGGAVIVGAATVIVGDLPFKPPSNLEMKGPAEFKNKAIRDLFLLSSTPSGKRLLARIEASGQQVTLTPEADPHNSFCSATSWADAKAGRPTGSTVKYNPDVAIYGYDRAGGAISMPPQVVLGHEMVHALNNAEGTHKMGVDPNPPASQPTIEEEEAAAIGTGSHAQDPVTENTMRADLGLDRRDNHYGQDAPAPTGNLRPGGY